MTDLALETIGLTKQYGRATAVSRLNLTVPIASIYGFLGPNGAGKTTTIRMLLGLVRPSAGSMRILGLDSATERPAIAARVAAIVEAPCFYPYLTATENLRVFAFMAGRNPSATFIGEMLASVGLASHRDKPVRAFSFGMKQRLGIAACLVTSPDVLFLDEPLNGLDPAGVVEMRHLLTQLNLAGTTIFLSSHDLSEVEQLCTHLAIVRNGCLLSQGTIADAMTTSARILVRGAPLDSIVTALERFSPGIASLLNENVIQVELREPQIPEMIRALVDAGVDIYEIRVDRDSLEDIFLRVVGDTTADGSTSTGQDSV